jgi:hypothetical protein
MHIEAITKITNFPSVVEVGPLKLDRINLFVGPNNSGKSSILQSVLSLQEGFGIGTGHIRLDQPQAFISHSLGDILDFPMWGERFKRNAANIDVLIDRSGGESLTFRWRDKEWIVDRLASKEPDHLIVPYLSRRRPEYFSEEVKLEHATTIYSDMRFLAAKLTRVAQPSHPRYDA